MPEDVLLQTAERKEDVTTQSEGKSTSHQGPENKQKKSSLDIFDTSTHVAWHQRPKRTNEIAGSRTRNAATTNIFVRSTKKGNLCLLILAIFALLPGAEVYSDQTLVIKIRINQPVHLPSYSNEEDIVQWRISPTANHSEYYRLFDEVPIRRKDGCEGYHYRQDHSIDIARAQPCHGGRYTVSNRRNDPRNILLIVDETPEVSTETTDSSDAMPEPTTNPASNTSGNTVLLVACFCVGLLTCVLVAAVVITMLCRTGKCNGIRTKRVKVPSNGSNYHEVSSQESAVTTVQTTGV